MYLTVTSRKRLFGAALLIEGSSRVKWARDYGVHPTHLTMVLCGTRQSMELTAKIDAYIARVLTAKQVGRAVQMAA